MIVVTHTAHADANDWTGILRAAGVPVLGEELPSAWSDHAKENVGPAFFASLRDQGVYYKTNPDPYTSVYLDAAEAAPFTTTMKVMGVLRTERAYLGHVLASMPHWRAVRGEVDGMSPILQWWNDYFGLLRDAATRRYPLRLVSREALSRAPEETLGATFDWLGIAPTDAAFARAKGLPAAPEADPEAGEDVPATVLDVFDELHRRVDRDEGFDRPFLEHLYAVNEALAPRILRLQVASLKTQAQRLRRRDPGE